MLNKVSLFKGARNIDIKDSSIVVNVDTFKQGKLDRLLEEVAPHAILNAGGRADEVRCYPGTREEVIGKIEKWMNGKGLHQSRMMWLSGPAGAGKSAIAQTVAERCQKRGMHAANFFFFRGDGTRNHAQPLVSTLAYQLLDFYPALEEILEDRLMAKPLIGKASTEEQFVQLISTPIQTVHRSSLVHQPIILIVDGLDECADERKQEQILKALYALVEENDLPFRVLVSSRAEPHLVMFFNKIAISVKSVFLDSEYRPQDDIRRFVIGKLDEIKRIHSLSHTLSEQWPEAAHIDAITDKSSGQFIYAATVVRFIQHSSASPAISLLQILEMRPAVGHSPFAQLDAVYSYIFSKASDIHTVKLILGAHFLSKVVVWNRTLRLWHEDRLFQTLLEHSGSIASETNSVLADLVPIVKVDEGKLLMPLKLVFYHASLSDYLHNESRSGIYYVNMATLATEWTSLCFEKNIYLDSYELGVQILLKVGKATPGLSKTLLNASERKLDENARLHMIFCMKHWWSSLMMKISGLYFESDRDLYKQLLQCWIRFHINNFEEVPTIEDTFDEGSVSREVYKYYNWYTEGLKFAIGSHT